MHMYGRLKKRLLFGLVRTAFFTTFEIVMVGGGGAGQIEGGVKLFFEFKNF